MNRGAQVWSAPEDEVITGVSFYWNRQSSRPEVYIAVFDLTGVETSAEFLEAPVLWSVNEPRPSGAGNMTLTFDESQGITAIGLGFYDTRSEPNNRTLFNTISVTTAVVPEPMILTLLSLAGMGLIRRRK